MLGKRKQKFGCGFWSVCGYCGWCSINTSPTS